MIENVLRSRFRVAGSVKRLTDDPNTQDMDHEEAMKLAKENKLLLASEFYLTCYRAADYYNREKTHPRRPEGVDLEAETRGSHPV